MAKKGELPELKNRKKSKKWLVILIIGIVLLLAAGGAWWVWNFVINTGDNEAGLGGIFGNENKLEPIYSAMTGLEISNSKLNNSPVYCMQIPNGSTDGARPQVGLTSAAVVFEAIAETGITRFAAIFQNAEDTMIGPIRSLRPYYLEWDTPFDCTVVHDGGSTEALAAVGNGHYRNLDENLNYMWKETYINGQYRYWNNVFTSAALLNKFNTDKGYTSSSPKTFPRLKPADVETALASLEPVCDEAGVCADPENITNSIYYRFTNIADYNVIFRYDRESNTYLRYNGSYAGEIAHESYHCPSTATEPPAGCELKQVAPSAVVVMRVKEHTMADGYHEAITTTGVGDAVIFQNGQALEGTWSKRSAEDQIVFKDASGAEISFTPGQLWIAAVPQFGSVSWE